MLRLRRYEKVRLLYRSHYADEWVGLIVLAAIVLFVVAIAEAGLLKQWLTPERRIHFVLPESGVAGLAVGNDIEVMGVHAGAIRKLDLNSTGTMYAEGSLEPQFLPFIRQDSKAVIRRRFVVAGASYIEIERGRGPDMDWGYAVLTASVEPNPADVIAGTVKDVRLALLPVMENVQHITSQLDAALQDVRAGKGSLGGLMARDDTLRQIHQLLDDAHITLTRLQPIEGNLGGVMEQTKRTMANVRVTTETLRQSMPQVQQAIGHASAATGELPDLLVQAQATAYSLHRLTDQLRGLWLLGGHGASSSSGRLPAQDVRP